MFVHLEYHLRMGKFYQSQSERGKIPVEKNLYNGVESMRRFKVTLVFVAIIALYWYGHTHLVMSWEWASGDRNFGNVFMGKMVDIHHFQSLYQFNSWLGWNASYQRPVTWNAWIGLLLLECYPSKILAVILFVISFWIKLPVLILLYLWVFKLTRKRVKKGHRDRGSANQVEDDEVEDKKSSRKPGPGARERRRPSGPPIDDQATRVWR
jgi:hypothetical protein